MSKQKTMKLTHPDAWHQYAGGTFAAPDKRGYDAFTTIGRYMITPISNQFNSNRHIGYDVKFCNEKGILEGGLYQNIGPQPKLCFRKPSPTTVNLLTARRLCQNHHEIHKGTLIPPTNP